MKKLTFKQYSDRKLAHVKKARQRKKILKGMDALFLKYCVARYSASLSVYLYATYERHVEAELMKSNPFLAFVSAGSDFCGAYLPVPMKFE